MATTSIEWTDTTWNPVRGCSRVSPGCVNCYAERMAARFSGPGQPFEGLAKRTSSGPRWTGKVEMIGQRLLDPLGWRKPRRVFVNSMSDLFHEGLEDRRIDLVFGVMAITPRHTYQILTKRPERMLEYFSQPDIRGRVARAGARYLDPPAFPPYADTVWPLPNVWLGVSVEDQERADERIPPLLQTPAAVRFLSCEPLLGPVNLPKGLRSTRTIHVSADVQGMLRNRSFDCLQHDDGRPMTRREAEDELFALHAKGVKLIPAGPCEGFDPQSGCPGHPNPNLDWVIVGGESGPGARRMEVEWARSLVEQCRIADVPVFVKQMGSHGKVHPKGGDPSEWPEDLRVREFPEVASHG